MKRLFDYINSKVLVNVAGLNSANLITKIVAGLLTTKFIAVYIGAEGLALIGNLKNFLTAIQSFATVGLYKGIVKYIGEFKNDSLKLSKTISTSYYLGFLFTTFICFLCYSNAEVVNDFIFSAQNDYTYVVKIMALALPFYALNVFCFSIMNGFSKYKILLMVH